MDTENNKFAALIQEINRQLKEVLRILKMKHRLNGQNILDNQDLCMMLRLSKRSLQRHRATGNLPFIQIGGKPFYYESDIEEFIRKNKVKGSSSEDEDSDAKK